ncbi:MAG: hypothetical protein K1X94_06220 [Sandaracinaceae bacterium]|nr:hypothetical protein [Sandaracinaceae bacterium]
MRRAALGLLVATATLGCREVPAAPEPERRDAGPRRDAFVETCVSTVLAPVVETRPNDVVDVIMVIDNSGSMFEEATQVQIGLNAFARTLAESGLDYHLVLLSQSDGPTGVCVPPPLGTGAGRCEAGPEGRLLPIHVEVGSHDAPFVVLAQYPRYRDFLRPGSVRAFLWVTDDDANTTADMFRASLERLEPDGFGISVHHAIVGYFGDTGPGAWNDELRGRCDSLARVGLAYLQLSQCYTASGAGIPDCTTGTIARVCESDWTATFARIAERTSTVAIVEPVSCTLVPPSAPEGRVLDLSRMSVTYRSGAETRLLRHTPSGACSGWRFDDESNPTRIELCPAICREVSHDPDAQLEVDIACFDDPG